MKKYGYWAALVAIVGGFLQSYVTCAIAGALCFICAEFELSSFQEGMAAGIILLGALVGTMLCGTVADSLGRRKSLMIAAVLYLFTSAAIFWAASYEMLLLFRFIAGIGVGMTAILVPLYLAEIAPTAKRGALVASFQLAVTMGTLAAYLANIHFIDSGDWRSMFFLAAIPALFQFIALFFFPESPRWLLASGQNQKAARISLRLYGKQAETPISEPHPAGWKELLNPSFRFVLGIGIALSVLQQFCGINGIIYFTPKIFAQAGFSTPQDAMLPTLIIGVVNFLSTFLSIFLMDRAGRRKLLLLSLLGVSFALLVLTLGFALHAPSPLVSVFALVAYVAFFSIGLGPVTWVLISEIYPLPIRAKAISTMTFLSWTSNYLVVLTFPLLLFQFGPTSTFTLYTLISLGALLLFFRCIPETKNKSLEQLEALLYKKNRKGDFR